jgi:hypothetical protein
MVPEKKMAKMDDCSLRHLIVLDIDLKMPVPDLD